MAVCTVETFYLQYMGVAVVISFVRALETEIPLGGGVILPPVVTNGCKKGWEYEG